MKFDREETDYGFSIGHSFEFKGERVAIRFSKNHDAMMTKAMTVELLIEAMIQHRIDKAMPFYGLRVKWRRFKRWLKSKPWKRQVEDSLEDAYPEDGEG